MLWVGLTGGIGSGKSTVARLFASLGTPVIDADEIAHQISTAGGIAALAAEELWGEAALNSSKGINRNWVRQKIFTDPAAKQAFEDKVHPAILENARQQASQLNAPYLIFVVPILFERPLFREAVQHILVIDCAEHEQIRRVQQRNGWDEATIHNIMAQQASRHFRLQHANDVLLNDGDIETLRPAVQQLDQHYRKLAGAA
jgi:dephospho-CoA kinase